jgi:putative transposase
MIKEQGSMADTFGASRKFRILAVIDDCCRENLSGRRHQHLGRKGGPRAGGAGQDLWQAGLHRQRQSDRVH